jgi:hypothetical protein
MSGTSEKLPDNHLLETKLLPKICKKYIQFIKTQLGYCWFVFGLFSSSSVHILSSYVCYLYSLSSMISFAVFRESYLVMEKILEAVERTGAQAVHPGLKFSFSFMIFPIRRLNMELVLQSLFGLQVT